MSQTRRDDEEKEFTLTIPLFGEMQTPKNAQKRAKRTEDRVSITPPVHELYR